MKPQEHSLSATGRIYVACVIAAGVGVIVYSLGSSPTETLNLGYVALVLLTLVSGSFTVKIPGATSTISVSETFVIVAAITYGPGPAALLVALEGLIVSLWLLKNTKEVYRVFFNMATGAVSVWLSANLFFLLAPTPLVLDAPTSVLNIVVPLFVFATVYFLLNSWLIALAIAIDTRRPPFLVWKNAFLFLALNYISGASLAALLLPYIESFGLGTIAIVAPLMVLAYVTFRTTMGRIADTNAHLVEVNRLYLSTIETLAMAIDAKDQITHGHVRRVQSYATGLARKMGLTSEADIKAIEAAALLHDMGKLAIPEYILNKPGKLTEAEFEKMKRHASIGAEILSAIDFPYPVVPIVRYHHESWDGSGYPDGLSGESIPIGARILSVVDCFDALTSDRPYRPRLSETEALQIVNDRSGTMYDPTVVRRFTEVYRQIAPPEAELGQRESLLPLSASNRAFDRVETLDKITSNSEENQTLFELAQALRDQATLETSGETIAKHLRRLVPASVFSFFIYDLEHDDLGADYVYGLHADAIAGTRIPMGQHLTGWVAANRQTVVNSDPALDLGDVVRSLEPRLRSCLSTPMQLADGLVGVLTLYSSRKDAFSDDHQRIVELVAGQVANNVRQAVSVETPPTIGRDRPSPSRSIPSELARFFEHGRHLGFSGGGFSLLLIAGGQLRIAEGQGGIEQLRASQTINSLRASLRSSDLLFQDGDEYVALLPETDGDDCRVVADKLRKNLVTTTVLIGGATSPADGVTLSDLLTAARSRLEPTGHWAEPEDQPTPSVH